jgi:hypothetical protein
MFTNAGIRPCSVPVVSSQRLHTQLPCGTFYCCLRNLPKYSFSFEVLWWEVCHPPPPPHASWPIRVTLTVGLFGEEYVFISCKRAFGWKLCREEPLEKPRYRWKDNIKIDLRAEGPKLLHLARPQDFAFIYACLREKNTKYYIWNINNLILLKRPSSNT